MKKITLFSLIIASVILGCKKDVSEAESIPAKSKFSYSTFVINENAEVTSEATQNSLTFTFTKPGMELNLPSLYVNIFNFHGPGTYGSKDGVTVYGSEDDNEEYWEHNYSYDDPTIRSHAKVIVKRADDHLIAEIEGELMHAEVIGNDVIKKYTSFKGSTQQTLYRR